MISFNMPILVLLLSLGCIANSLNTTYSNYCGGAGGSAFDDKNYFETHGYPTEIEIRAGSVIDSIRFWYGGVAAGWHGGDGGELYSFLIPEKEWISGIVMSFGEESRDDNQNKYVCELTFELYQPEVGNRYFVGPYGKCKFDSDFCGNYTYHEPMRYIKGQSGSLLDYLHAVFTDE